LRHDDRLIRDPFLVVEILSPSTAAFDQRSKAADYRRIPSVQEILLIDSEHLFAEVLRRRGDDWISEIARGAAAVLSLNSVPLRIAMTDLYEGMPPPEPLRGNAGTAEE
jgi:Uma2 family endonuclease